MTTEHSQRHLRELLLAVRQHPTVMPLAELAALNSTGVDVSIDRSGDETLVFVTNRADQRFDSLSPREHEVSTLVAAGMSNGEIAESLFVSVATVKDHLHSIFNKAGFSSRSQLIAAWYGGFDG